MKQKFHLSEFYVYYGNYISLISNFGEEDTLKQWMLINFTQPHHLCHVSYDLLTIKFYYLIKVFFA